MLKVAAKVQIDIPYHYNMQCAHVNLLFLVDAVGYLVFTILQQCQIKLHYTYNDGNCYYSLLFTLCMQIQTKYLNSNMHFKCKSVFI